jgi:tetratricopeptide (TPR) repeat protein
VEFTSEQADAHNALTKAGWEIAKPEIYLDDGRGRRAPGFFARRRLRKATALFAQALKINPQGWSSMWALGKIYQRFWEHKISFKWFLEAHQLNPRQPDVAREAGLAALDLGFAEDAVRLCLIAVQLSPDDLGLQSNLALAYLLSGDDARALECASVAAKAEPGDVVSRNVLALVCDVRAGRRLRPKRMSELRCLPIRVRWAARIAQFCRPI